MVISTEQNKRQVHEWEIHRLTELLLTGYSWRKVRDFMMLSKNEFDVLLDDAVGKAQREQHRLSEETESVELT